MPTVPEPARVERLALKLLSMETEHFTTHHGLTRKDSRRLLKAVLNTPGDHFKKERRKAYSQAIKQRASYLRFSTPSPS